MESLESLASISSSSHSANRNRRLASERRDERSDLRVPIGLVLFIIALSDVSAQ